MKRWGYDLDTAEEPAHDTFYVMNTYVVKAQRPNRLAIAVTGGIEREVNIGGRRQRQFRNTPDTIYINNGKRSITLLTGVRMYKTGHGLDALNKDLSDLAVNVQAYWTFHQDPMYGYVLVPESLAAPSPTVIYTFTDPKSPDLQQRIYFDRKAGNLIQASDFDKDEKGNWIERRRQEFKFWDIDALLPVDTFNVRPPRNYRLSTAFGSPSDVRSLTGGARLSRHFN